MYSSRNDAISIRIVCYMFSPDILKLHHRFEVVSMHFVSLSTSFIAAKKHFFRHVVLYATKQIALFLHGFLSHFLNQKLCFEPEPRSTMHQSIYYLAAAFTDEVVINVFDVNEMIYNTLRELQSPMWTPACQS